MVAPIDSKATFQVEGETITLRLNFRSIALAKAEGVSLLTGMATDEVSVAVALRCLAIQDHPEMTDEEAFAIAIKGGEAVGKALTELFQNFGGQTSAEGNATKKPPAKAKAKA